MPSQREIIEAALVESLLLCIRANRNGLSKDVRDELKKLSPLNAAAVAVVVSRSIGGNEREDFQRRVIAWSDMPDGRSCYTEEVYVDAHGAD